MELAAGETKIIKTAKFGNVKVWNFNDKEIHFTWGKHQDKGFLNLENGECTVPQNVIDAVAAAL